MRTITRTSFDFFSPGSTCRRCQSDAQAAASDGMWIWVLPCGCTFQPALDGPGDRLAPEEIAAALLLGQR